jgi:hypothetical protein
MCSEYTSMQQIRDEVPDYIDHCVNRIVQPWEDPGERELERCTLAASIKFQDGIDFISYLIVHLVSGERD